MTRKRAQTTRGSERTPAQTVRESFDASTRSDIEGVLDCQHPEVEWILVGGLETLGASRYHGHDGLRKFFAEFSELMATEFEVERLIQIADRVVALVITKARGAGSGAPAEQRWAGVFSFRDGLIVRGELFYDRDQALRSLGLSAWPEE